LPMAHYLLLIEDNADVGVTVSALLKAMDFEVEWVQEAESALAAYRRRRPDLVLTDIELPHMSGLELLREIRRMNPNAKVVAMSGSGPADPGSLLDRAREQGAIAALAKPFGFDELAAVLRQAMDR
jgi:two-component system, NtrC family, nitrogen regulation response regulator NtrX